MSRECGSCDMCCTVVGVKEMDKPEYTACAKLCGGCGIYESRPQSCKTYECLWLQGNFNEADRPDKLGLICDLLTVTGVGETVMVRIPDEKKIMDRQSKEAKFISRLIKEDIIITAIFRSGVQKMFGRLEIMKKFITKGVTNGTTEKV